MACRIPWLLLLASVLCLDAVAEPPVIPEEVKTRVRQRVDSGYTPGVVICMVNADGRSYFNYGKTGHAPGSQAVDSTTLYEIASVTKTFTTVLLADMVRTGDVSLGDTVGSFLPAGVNMPANGGDAITLEQLANHTSGIPTTPPNLIPAITDLANQFENYTVELLYEFLNTYTLTRAPGSDYEYSNAGIALLGHVLALSQGIDFETLLRERILDPMSLFDTAIELDRFQQARTAPPHHGVVQRPPFEMGALGAAGGLKSCAFDLGTYLEQNLGFSGGDLRPGLLLSHQQTTAMPGNGYTTGPRLVAVGRRRRRPTRRRLVRLDGVHRLAKVNRHGRRHLVQQPRTLPGTRQRSRLPLPRPQRAARRHPRGRPGVGVAAARARGGLRRGAHRRAPRPARARRPRGRSPTARTATTPAGSRCWTSASRST